MWRRSHRAGGEFGMRLGSRCRSTVGIAATVATAAPADRQRGGEIAAILRDHGLKIGIVVGMLRIPVAQALLAER